MGLGLELALSTNSLDRAHLKSIRVGLGAQGSISLACIYINRGVYSYHFSRLGLGSWLGLRLGPYSNFIRCVVPIRLIEIMGVKLLLVGCYPEDVSDKSALYNVLLCNNRHSDVCICLLRQIT